MTELCQLDEQCKEIDIQLDEQCKEIDIQFDAFRQQDKDKLFTLLDTMPFGCSMYVNQCVLILEQFQKYSVESNGIPFLDTAVSHEALDALFNASHCHDQGSGANSHQQQVKPFATGPSLAVQLKAADAKQKAAEKQKAAAAKQKAAAAKQKAAAAKQKKAEKAKNALLESKKQADLELKDQTEAIAALARQHGAVQAAAEQAEADVAKERSRCDLAAGKNAVGGQSASGEPELAAAVLLSDNEQNAIDKRAQVKIVENLLVQQRVELEKAKLAADSLNIDEREAGFLNLHRLNIDSVPVSQNEQPELPPVPASGMGRPVFNRPGPSRLKRFFKPHVKYFHSNRVKLTHAVGNLVQPGYEAMRQTTGLSALVAASVVAGVIAVRCLPIGENLDCIMAAAGVVSYLNTPPGRANLARIFSSNDE
jgi:hypothetical protein